jgi:hypothetical protein
MKSLRREQSISSRSRKPMTPETFVSEIRSAVVQQNAAIYKDLFESTTPEAAHDPYWKRALTLHRSLSEADRTVLFEIMRQVTVDTVSNLFAILDGVSALAGLPENFVLTSQSDHRKLNGSLKDMFLEEEQGTRS